MDEMLDRLRAGGDAVSVVASAALNDDALRVASDADVFEVMSAAAEVIRRAEAVIIEAVAQVEQRSSSPARNERASTRAGCSSVTEVVQRCTRASRQVAKRYQRVAAAISRDVSITTGELLPAKYPALRDALREGAIGADGLEAALQPMLEADARLTTDERLQADVILAAYARGESDEGAGVGGEADGDGTGGDPVGDRIGGDDAGGVAGDGLGEDGVGEDGVGEECGDAGGGEREAAEDARVRGRGMGAVWPLAVSADGLRRHAKLIAMYLDEDGAEPREQRAMRKRSFTIGRERDGLVHVRGNVLPETAAQLQTLLDAYLNPKRKGPRFAPTNAPAPMEAPTPKGAAGRTNSSASTITVPGDASADDAGGDDAGAEVARVANASIANVSVDDASARDASARDAGAGDAGTGDANADGGAMWGLVGPDLQHADLMRVDDRTRPQEQHDALAGILEVAARHPDVPTIGGSAPTLTVIVNAEDLTANRGWASVERTGEPVSLSVARHVACVGAVQRVTSTASGRVVKLDTTDRIFNAHQRRAILLRDGGCIIPGCTVPAAWCEIHHVHEYARGGPTHIDNGVALCWHHHRTIDTNGWSIRMRDGAPEVRAPHHWDASGRWRPAGNAARRPRRRAG